MVIFPKNIFSTKVTSEFFLQKIHKIELGKVLETLNNAKKNVFFYIEDSLLKRICIEVESG